MDVNQQIQDHHSISEQDRAGLYNVIYGRRDVRGQFKSDPIDEATLYRVLNAAHHAPSVGFMQPWNFIIIEKDSIKKQVHQLFEKANSEAEKLFEGHKGQLYKNLKLEGILSAPINLCITCDRNREGEHVLGRTHQKDTDIYSTVCAVQNLWLAARAEGLGVGWVSIFDETELKKVLGIPKDIVLVAYLCMGHVSHFYSDPELENLNWNQRRPIDQLIYRDEWGQASKANSDTSMR